jgi:hypothetical protein
MNGSSTIYGIVRRFDVTIPFLRSVKALLYILGWRFGVGLKRIHAVCGGREAGGWKKRVEVLGAGGARWEDIRRSRGKKGRHSLVEQQKSCAERGTRREGFAYRGRRRDDAHS